MGIKAVDYQILNIGFIFKSIKKTHLWIVEIDRVLYKIEFVTSKFSKERKVFVDSESLFVGLKGSEFSFTFYQASHILTITENSRLVDLHIDGFPFSVISKRQAGSFVQFSEVEDQLNPLVLVEYSMNAEKKRDLDGWEKKARNFRIVQREVPLGVCREKIKIRPRAVGGFIKPLSVEPSPRSTQVSSPSALSVPINHAIRSKRRKNKKTMNFFLI